MGEPGDQYGRCQMHTDRTILVLTRSTEAGIASRKELKSYFSIMCAKNTLAVEMQMGYCLEAE